MRDLATSLKSPQNGTWTQNDLQLTLNNSKLFKILGNKLNICLLYMFKISTLLMVTIKSYHFKKKLTSKLRLKILDALISLNTNPNDMNFSHIYIPLWSIRSQSCKFKNAQTKEIWPKNQIWHKVFKSS
jgi:hypothetical protein